MSTGSDFKWTQHCELASIDRLGTFQTLGGETKKEQLARRIRCLEGYLRALPRRAQWFEDAMPEMLRQYAQAKLERLREAEWCGRIEVVESPDVKALGDSL